MKLAGLLLIINALLVGGWYATTGGSKSVILICSLAVLTGFALTIQERITEFTIEHVGSVKARAESKLAEIEDIRAAAEAQRATIDLIATEATQAKRLAEDIKKKSEDVEEKVKTIDSAIRTASTQTKELSAILQFTNTVVAAQNNDRKAFDQLCIWIKDDQFAYREPAHQAWMKIINDHDRRWMNVTYPSPWAQGFDASKLSKEELMAQYKLADEVTHSALIHYIWGRNDIPKVDRLDIMMDLMLTEKSLSAVEQAGTFFVRATGLDFPPLAVEDLHAWWNKNRNTIKD